MQGGQAQYGGVKCKNRFSALQARHDVEKSPNMVMSMLRIFDFDVYALLESGANLSFVTPYLVIRFDMTPEILLEPFLVYTLIR